MLRARPPGDIEGAVGIHTRLGGNEPPVDGREFNIRAHELLEVRLYPGTPRGRGHQGMPIECQERKAELHEIAEIFERLGGGDAAIRAQ